MIERHLLKLRARDSLSAEEEQAIRSAIGDVRDHPAGRTLASFPTSGLPWRRPRGSAGA